jgi:hypothetical protein
MFICSYTSVVDHKSLLYGKESCVKVLEGIAFKVMITGIVITLLK